jgi:type VI secretion system protein ImpA
MPLREDLLNPIPGANPCGENLRYSPVYDKIKEARREDIDAPVGDWEATRKLADYAVVVQLAGETLAAKTKDLQIATWLAEAMLQREGLAGFSQAVALLRDLVAGFWDNLYPELEDGDAELRAAPLDWLGNKLEPAVRSLPLTSSGISWSKYRESRTVGSEAAATTEIKRKAREALIAEGKLTAEEFDQVVDGTPLPALQKVWSDSQSLVQVLDQLREVCDEKFGDAAPGFLKLRSAAEEIGQTFRIFISRRGDAPAAAAPIEAQQPELEPEPRQSVEVPRATQAAAATAPARDASEPAGREDAARRIAAVARFLRKQDAYNIDPFLILRGFRWGELRYNGAQIDQRMLEAPPPELRTRLKRLASEQNWAELLEAAEEGMEQPCGRAWLDLQRYAVTALDSMGQWYKEVTTAIRTGLRGLLTDLPGLAGMTLSDDTPTANAETLAWIEAEVMTGAGPWPVGSGAPARAYGEEAAPQAPATVALNAQFPQLAEGEALEAADVFERALHAASGGRLAEAVELISRQLATERSGRERFRRRMQLAHILMAGGRDRHAFPLLQELIAEIDRRGLEEWEPGEALAYPLTLLLQCLTATGGDEGTRQELFTRICRLDPVQALNCPE